MSQHHHHSPVSYMDGVPVKISERYRPPPKISLPQKLTQCLADVRLANPLEPAAVDSYSFVAEQAAHLLVRSRRSTRDQERGARRQRQHQRQVQRQRELDEQQKRELGAVSYPSDDDDEVEAEEEKEKVEEEAKEESPSSSLSPSPPQQSARPAPSQPQPVPQQRFDTILMPTLASAKTGGSSSTAAPDLSTWTFANKLNGHVLANAKINWSDFENDTSSPFDNIELTAINELDILAQVLNLNAEKPQEKASVVVAAPATTTTTATCDTGHSSATTTTTTTSTSAPIAASPPQLTTAPPQPMVGNAQAFSYNEPSLLAGSPQAASCWGSPSLAQQQLYPDAQYTNVFAPIYGDYAQYNYRNYPLPLQQANHPPITHHQNRGGNGGAQSFAGYAPLEGGGAAGAGGGVAEFQGIVVGAFKSSSVPDILRHTNGVTGAGYAIGGGAAGGGGGAGAGAAAGAGNGTAPGAPPMRYF